MSYTGPRHFDWDNPQQRPEAARIADGVRDVQQARHEGFTTEATREAAAFDEAQKTLRAQRVVRPVAGPSGALGQMMRALIGEPDPAQVAAAARAQRRAEWVDRAHAAQQWLVAGILAVVLITVAVIAYNVCTNMWRWGL